MTTTEHIRDVTRNVGVIIEDEWDRPQHLEVLRLLTAYAAADPHLPMVVHHLADSPYGRLINLLTESLGAKTALHCDTHDTIGRVQFTFDWPNVMWTVVEADALQRVRGLVRSVDVLIVVSNSDTDAYIHVLDYHPAVSRRQITAAVYTARRTHPLIPILFVTPHSTFSQEETP
jgi:hypothetical protein